VSSPRRLSRSAIRLSSAEGIAVKDPQRTDPVAGQCPRLDQCPGSLLDQGIDPVELVRQGFHAPGVTGATAAIDPAHQAGAERRE
jgi:hypothetical protein